jgi:hypothetical protein
VAARSTFATFPGGTLGGDIANVSSLQGGYARSDRAERGLARRRLQGVRGSSTCRSCSPTPRKPTRSSTGHRQEALRPAAAEGARGPRVLGAWIPQRHQQQAPDREARGLLGRSSCACCSRRFHRHVTALGANAVPMPFPEVYTALEQKVVDGQENPVTVVADSKFRKCRNICRSPSTSTTRKR